MSTATMTDYSKLHTFAAALADALTKADTDAGRPAWTYVPHVGAKFAGSDVAPHEHPTADLECGTLRLVVIDGNWWGTRFKGRYIIHGANPERPLDGDYMRADGGDGEITVASERPAADVAREIVRRCLPEYTRTRAAYLEKLAAENAATERDWSMMDRLQLQGRAGTRRMRYGSRYLTSEEYQRSEGPHGEVKFNGGTHCELVLSGLTVEQVEALMAQLGLT